MLTWYNFANSTNFSYSGRETSFSQSLTLDCRICNLSATFGNWIFSIISGDSERKCTPRGGACTVSVAYPTYGFAAGKDIPKVVSDGEINPNIK